MEELKDLGDAANQNWARVEPAIFGTLTERALDPEKRKSLGAHYTPRSYVERLVRPLVERPLREKWEAGVKLVAQRHWERAQQLLSERARLTTLAEQEQAKKLRQRAVAEERRALNAVEAFRRELGQIRVLDPACGTGNFLYVCYALLKELEREVAAFYQELGAEMELVDEQAKQLTLAVGAASIQSISPSSMLGIEKDNFAAEIAQLVLWIGHLQWELAHGRSVSDLDEPIIPETKTIQAGDAVLDWDRREPRKDANGSVVTRWKWGAMKPSSNHDGEVPDESQREITYDYLGARATTWPRADFIVGNPPFIGNKLMRIRLGDGYVEALRAAYPEVPDSVDFVMYWWFKAAHTAKSDASIRSDTSHPLHNKVRLLERFGFITTNKIRQRSNRQVVDQFVRLASAGGPALRLVFGLPDHPWYDDREAASVRISMTGVEVADEGASQAAAEYIIVDDESCSPPKLSIDRVAEIHSDLTIGVDTTGVVPLVANEGLAFQGMNVLGDGMKLTADEVDALGFSVDSLPPIIRPYLSGGGEMMGRAKDLFVIDAFGETPESLAKHYPTLLQKLRDEVKPLRDANSDKKPRERWWEFGRPREDLREASEGLSRVIITGRSTVYRAFEWLETRSVPDCQLVVICLEDPFHLGVLESRVHRIFTVARGGRKGVVNNTHYDHTETFLSFPFPMPSADEADLVRTATERLLEYRGDARRRDPRLTLTTICKLVAIRRAKAEIPSRLLRAHKSLGTDEMVRRHEDLDRAVLTAYGWPEALSDQGILRRLVALNAERSAEEADRLIRRPGSLEPRRADARSAAQPGDDALTSELWGPSLLDQALDVLHILQAAEEPTTLVQLSERFATRRGVQRVTITQTVEEVLSHLERRGFARKTATGWLGGDR